MIKSEKKKETKSKIRRKKIKLQKDNKRKLKDRKYIYEQKFYENKVENGERMLEKIKKILAKKRYEKRKKMTFDEIKSK